MGTPRGRDRTELWLVAAGLSVLAVCVVALAVLVASVVRAPDPVRPAELAGISGPAPEPDPPGAIEGVVTDATGGPVARVRVTVHGRLTGESVLPGGSSWDRTDARGGYRITVPAGSYRISFGGPGGASYALEHHPDVATFEQAADVEVGSGEEVEVDAEVEPGARLAGRVLDSTGRPVRGSQRYVSVETERLEGWVSVVSGRVGRDGRWSLAGLPAGRYRVSYDDRRSGTVFHPAATRPGRARLVALAVGGERGGVDLRVPPPARLTGRVLSADGRPLPGVLVSVATGQMPVRSGAQTLWVPTGHAQTTTDASGHYEFAALPGGSYTLWAGSAYRVLCDDTGFRPVGLRVDGGRDTTHDVRAVARTTLSGTVSGKDGAPLAGVAVQAKGVGDNHCEGWTRTDAAGSYELTVFVGDYRLKFNPGRRARPAQHLPEYHRDAAGAAGSTTVRLRGPRRIDAVLEDASVGEAR